MMKGIEEGSTKRAKFYAVICPLIVAFVKHQAGFVVGWPAVLPKMQADNTTSFEVTDEDVQWLISITGIAGMATTLITGPMIEFFGPRNVIVWTQIPATIFWLVSAFSPYKALLYLGRIGESIILAIFGPLIPLLISEYSDPRIRGFMVAGEEVVVAVGLLVMYTMAHELYWSTATALCAASAMAMFVLCFMLPESPFWLARNGQYEKAEAALISLRFSKIEATEEMATLVSSIEATNQSKVIDQVKELKHCRNYRPVLLLLAIFVFREFGGEYVVFTYTVYMFKVAGVQIDPFMCTIWVGVTRTIACIVSGLLLDRLGRRPLLIGTCLVCALSSLLCGTYLLLAPPGTSWIPLAAVLLYVASYGLGLGPIPWGLTGEMIPTPVRSVGGSICLLGYSVSVFAIGYLFPVMMASIDIGPTFLCFTVSLVVLSIILCLWFPETKGKTLNDLERIFRRKSKMQLEVYTIHGNFEKNAEDSVTRF